MRSGERIKALRFLLEMSQPQFCDVFGIDFSRLKNVEALRAKVNEDDLRCIGKVFPESIPWIVYDGPIEIDESKHKDSEIYQRILKNIDKKNPVDDLRNSLKVNS